MIQRCYRLSVSQVRLTKILECTIRQYSLMILGKIFETSDDDENSFFPVNLFVNNLLNFQICCQP